MVIGSERIGMGTKQGAALGSKAWSLAWGWAQEPEPWAWALGHGAALGLGDGDERLIN